MSAFVYRIFDGDSSALLYIGAGYTPRSRLKDHQRRDWWPVNPHVEIDEHPDNDTAKLAESAAIKQLRPLHNVAIPTGAAALKRLARRQEQMRSAPPPWLTRAQVAALIGVTTRAVDVMTADGRLRKYKNGERVVRFRRDEVEAAFTAVEVD